MRSFDSGIGLSGSFRERKSTGNGPKILNCKPELSSLEIETENKSWSRSGPRASPRKALVPKNSLPVGIVQNESVQDLFSKRTSGSVRITGSNRGIVRSFSELKDEPKRKSSQV